MYTCIIWCKSINNIYKKKLFTTINSIIRIQMTIIKITCSRKTEAKTYRTEFWTGRLVSYGQTIGSPFCRLCFVYKSLKCTQPRLPDSCHSDILQIHLSTLVSWVPKHTSYRQIVFIKVFSIKLFIFETRTLRAYIKKWSKVIFLFTHTIVNI